MTTVSIIGLGWLGLPLAQSLQHAGFSVKGSKTSQAGVEKMQSIGINSFLFNIPYESSLKHPQDHSLFDADILVITLPPTGNHGVDNYETIVMDIANTAEYCGTKQLIFTSSTSVYGDVVGEINEDTVRQPHSKNSKALKNIEDFLLHTSALETTIFRLAGLVGDQRHPIYPLSGREQVKSPYDTINLVHQTDVISAIMTAINKPQKVKNSVYNICAPQHPLRQEYYTHIAKKVSLPPPQFTNEKTEVPRIITTHKFITDLEFIYQYPDPYTMPF